MLVTYSMVRKNLTNKNVILVITATSVTSECLYSASGLILTELRNRLKPTKLDSLRFYGHLVYLINLK